MEHKSFRRYTRDTQRLIYWLLSDYSNFKTGNMVGATPSTYHLYDTKKELKKLYVKHLGIKISELKPFSEFRTALKDKIEDTLHKNISENSKIEIILDDTEVLIREEFQKLLLQLDGTFSLALNMMSQEQANDFINWLFDLLLDNQIPMRKEIVDLYKKNENDKFIYSMLRNKKCCICGEYADLHHFEQVSSIGGYKFDDGLKTRFLPLCRKHHTEMHAIPKDEFLKKYQIKPIYLNKEQVKELKEIYKNHFKVFKEE